MPFGEEIRSAHDPVGAPAGIVRSTNKYVPLTLAAAFPACKELQGFTCAPARS